MGWPQIVYLSIMGCGLGVALAEHGKPKTGVNRFGYTLIATIIQLVLLSFGGFFS